MCRWTLWPQQEQRRPRVPHATTETTGNCARWLQNDSMHHAGSPLFILILKSLILLAPFLSVAVAVSGPVKQMHRVTLADGSSVDGQVVTAPNGKDVIEFLGIPFAEPPIGNLRFQRPKRRRWQGVWNATKQPSACIQTTDTAFGNFSGSNMWNPNTPTSEDCLYLNIWVPYNPQRQRRLNVMVWVYGGGFFSGCSTLDVYDGKILSTEEEVIVVSMNYRVTMFGFLYLGRPDAPGNVGLLDQLEALKWVRDHIASFGADQNEVTIFGESAGGASVSMQVLSPLSRGYFKRAIMQSGSATAPWAMDPPKVAIERVLELSEAARCNVTKRDEKPDFDVVLACLRSIPAEKLLEKEWITNEFCDFPWTPVVDGEFFAEDPKTSLVRGNFKKSEILVGSNLDEAMYFIVYNEENVFKKNIFFDEENFITSDAIFESSARRLLPRIFVRNTLVYDTILFEYRDWELPGSARRRQDALDKMLGDYHFTCNVNEFAEHYEMHGGKVFYYYFVHQSSQMYWPKWMGVLHAYEIPFIFGEPLNRNLPYTVEEQELAKRMMRYWANFARTGNPNIYKDGSYEVESWPAYTKNQEYLTLGVNVEHSQRYGHGPRRKYCQFWKKHIPKLMTATKNVSDMELKWKRSFDKWLNEYIVEWKVQFDRYATLQQYRYEDVQSGSCSGTGGSSRYGGR